MDGQPVAADSKHLYPTHIWTRSISSPSVPRLSTLSVANPPELAAAQCAATHLDLVPILFPQQSSLYQAKLLQYNKLIAPGRGGGLQTPPLPPILSSQPVHAGARSRSLSKVSNKESRARQSSQNCHGNRSTQNTPKPDRVLMTGKVTHSKMHNKKPDIVHGLPPKPKTSVSSAHLPHSNSVPSTPQQHARKFSFESREQSPNAAQSHSPRSAYSETNSVLPSLRPLPPRGGGCKYETGLKFSRRRIPYNIGTDPLDKLDLNSVQSKLSEDDERKLTTDMRELYDRLQPTAAVETKRQKLVQKLEKLLNDTWPGHDIRVHLFGSSGNLLCSDDSDVDICIVTPWKELEGICMLADLLAKHGMEKVVCVASAKVPIVKIWDPELELSCDMNVNNTLALENTRMIKTYVHIDERVRPLAMIIKYWTRRRILNDAAFGGTLSSYTWICMIIAFLQLRQPPVLPALHQRPHQKLPRQDGEIAAFADDVDKLRGFGEKNESTLGELLFEFFRFFAHEFDYSTSALSVRLGKLVTKTEKKWHFALNNQLCVEEPFNTNRNLGNTADDTAFRGIHLELRRAFDLIAQGNLEECCEQYVYPKEEEKIFQKPPPVSRPVLLRSASQQQSSRLGRGGYRNGSRHQTRNNGNHNNTNNSRRASSGLNYENNANPMYVPAAYAMALGTQDASSLYMQSPELVAQISALQLQENNLRFLQYTQSQAFAQQQALQHAQRMQGATPQAQSSTERSRTNSFDTPPLSAPIRPEMRPELYYYQMPIQQAQAFYSYAPYPSTPSNITSADYRRSSHRSTAANEAGHGSSGSTIRSHSQPASRPIAVVPPGQNFTLAAQMSNGFASVPARHINGIPIPSFIPDEGNDNELDSSTVDSPDDGKSSSYYTNPSSPRRASGTANGMPAFGDIGTQSSSPGHSAEEFAQPVPDSTSATSRSPSPLSKEIAYPEGSSSASLTATTSPKQLHRETAQTAPLVVNGSQSRHLTNNSPKQAWHGESNVTPDLGGYENPLHIHNDPTVISSQPVPGSDAITTSRQVASPVSDRPVVVNGSRPPSGMATPPISGPYFTNEAVTLSPEGALQVTTWQAGTLPPGHAAPPGSLPPNLQRFPRPVPSPLIAQLDLATETSIHANDLHHLSPVYETKSPSPSFTRKLELPLGENSSRTVLPNHRQEAMSETPKIQSKPFAEGPTPETDGFLHSNPRINGLVRENGLVRGMKSESDNAGTNGPWQKSRGRKRVNDVKGRSEAPSQGELPPKNEADRKGG
ncbi:hypothetical protein F5B22DRAFT_466322 [Xylaria bambusicola]|uniref:uncharacterized protein n=1 Tax=Xylaria bambusicola TaxID=326684 RepID=UPI0020088D14|nr:uncharacterized protein F5B22DRAFT_466322 [Xylaria bambusicola]KAI0522239.1 hypothetical protein F5B22DRAFT_466322 [Xylaria bambusicola]